MLINNETIIKDDNPLIRQKSKDVELPLSKENKQLLMDMLQYVEDSTNEEKAVENNLRPAVGISAIQVGVPLKMTAVVIKDENNEAEYKYALVNPKIVSNSVEKAALCTGEGCLSVDGKHEGYVYRSARVKVRGYDILQDKEITIVAKDYLAIVLQHELDHFKGVLFYDYISKDNPYYELDNSIIIE